MEHALTVIYNLHLESALISVLLSCNPEVNSWVIENNSRGGKKVTRCGVCAPKEVKHAHEKHKILHILNFAFFAPL